MSEICLDLHGTARRKMANLDQLLAFRCLQEHQFRPSRSFRPPPLLQSEHIPVKPDRLLQLIHSVPCVQQFPCLLHVCSIPPRADSGQLSLGPADLLVINMRDDWSFEPAQPFSGPELFQNVRILDLTVPRKQDHERYHFGGLWVLDRKSV